MHNLEAYSSSFFVMFLLYGDTNIIKITQLVRKKLQSLLPSGCTFLRKYSQLFRCRYLIHNKGFHIGKETFFPSSRSCHLLGLVLDDQTSHNASFSIYKISSSMSMMGVFVPSFGFCNLSLCDRITRWMCVHILNLQTLRTSLPLFIVIRSNRLSFSKDRIAHGGVLSSRLTKKPLNI